jgi:hypothetical protein
MNQAVPSVTRTDIIARVQKMSAIVRKVDRIEATATTWGDYAKANEAGWVYQKPLHDPQTPVWAVAVSGEFVAAQARGRVYKWGVMIFDATSGIWLRTDAGQDGPWPAFFDTLPLAPLN